MATFRQLLVNTLVTGVTSSFLWFALTFWVYLETRSVVATGVIGGMFSIASAVLGPVFGTYVDHHRKHQAVVLSGVISTGSFAVAAVVFYAVDADNLLQLTSPWFRLTARPTSLSIFYCSFYCAARVQGCTGRHGRCTLIGETPGQGYILVRIGTG